MTTYHYTVVDFAEGNPLSILSDILKQGSEEGSELVSAVSPSAGMLLLFWKHKVIKKSIDKEKEKGA